MLADKQVSSPPEPHDDPALGLRVAIARLSRRLRDTASGTGLTPTQTSVLFSIVRRGPLGMSALAEVEDLNPTMLSRVVSALVGRGLVVRTADVDDARAALVEATTAGVDLRAEIHAERTATLGAELARLDDEQRAALDAALPALMQLAQGLADRSPTARVR
jgi:DNA-binding MarR family transcriptional regulator